MYLCCVPYRILDDKGNQILVLFKWMCLRVQTTVNMSCIIFLLLNFIINPSPISNVFYFFLYLEEDMKCKAIKYKFWFDFDIISRQNKFIYFH